MDDHSMSESDISGLKETLYAQQKLLQKLYNELEAEREASATAANEALSVILRLQGEKAAVKMEAQQYKRLSEEKICHAQESLTIIEDVIYQKEMEVAALDHQVQAYRYKLLSMGCTDPGFGELKFLDKDNLLQRNENLTGETSAGSIGRRNSAPVSCKYKNVVNERESCSVPGTDKGSIIGDDKTRLEICDQASDSDRKGEDSCSGGINSFWGQIRKLDVRVKEIAGANCMNSRSVSPSSSASSGKNESYLCQKNKSAEPRNGVAVDSLCSMSIHDVFEVPNVDENLNFDKVAHPEAVKMDGGDQSDWIKKVLQSTHCENKLLQTSNINCNLVVVEPRTSVSESLPTLNHVVRTSEIIEEVDERSGESSNREEELKLLNEIKEKLDSLHDEIRELKVKKKCSTRDEPSLSVLSEAMLYFWL